MLESGSRDCQRSYKFHYSDTAKTSGGTTLKMSRATQKKYRIRLQVERYGLWFVAFLTRNIIRKGDGESMGQYLKATAACSATAIHDFLRIAPNVLSSEAGNTQMQTNLYCMKYIQIFSKNIQ